MPHTDIVGSFWERQELLAEDIKNDYARRDAGELPPEHPADAHERQLEIDCASDPPENIPPRRRRITSF